MNGEEGNPPEQGPPRPLEYRSARDERPQPPAAVQALVGFASAAATSAVFNFFSGFFASAFLNGFNWPGRSDPLLIALGGVVVLGIVVSPLLIFIGIGRNMRRRGRWPAFLPGAIVGWGLAALVEGLCFAAMMS